MHIYVNTVCAKQINCQFLLSPSARKVWIEIVVAMAADKIVMVTFREEGVD